MRAYKNYRLNRGVIYRWGRKRTLAILAGVGLTAIFLLSIVSLMTPDAARAQLAANLVGYWRLNENTGTAAADSSGSGNNGTIVRNTGTGSPAWTSPGRNGIGSALQFDGTGTLATAANTVNLGNSSTLDAMPKYILSAWVKFDPGYVGACGGNGWANLVGRNAGGNNWAYMLYVNGSGNLRVHHKQSNGTAKLYDSAATVPTGQWTHVAQVADGGRLRLYINGVEDSNSATATAANTYDGTAASMPSANTYIGQDTRECAPLGAMDEVSIHNTFAAPGGVYGGLEYWLRTDDMELTNGIATNWDDVYGLHTNEQFIGGANITLGDGFNFHNTARFNAGYLSFTNEQLLYGATSGEVFSMVQTLRQPDVTSGYPYEFGGGGSDAGWAYQYPPSPTYPRLITGFGSTVRKIWTPTSPASGPARDVRNPLIFNELSRAGEFTARFNGLTNYTTATNAVDFNTSNSGSSYIGAAHNSRFGDANLSEVITYRRSLTTNERERVQSYMAVTYGMTLGTTTTPLDYKASDGSTIWTGSTTYQNDIAGIGRDDVSLLNQKQSTSENPGAFVVIGNGTIAADNESNPNNFASDKTFMMWGDNAGSTNVVTNVVPVSGTQFKRMQRIWDIQETGAVGTAKLRIPQSALSGTSPKLLVSNDEIFDAADQQIVLTANGANYEADVNFTGDQFFTFAVDMVAPGTTTNPATSITQTSATLNGTLDSLGDFDEATVFFRWRVQGSGNPFTETSPLQATSAPSTFAENISGLTLGTTYEYKAVVQWQNAGTQESEGSLLSFVTDPAVPPGAALNLQAVSAGTSQINLSWGPPADEGGSPVTGYHIERSPNGANNWTTIMSDTGNTNTTYQNTGLNSNTEYFYRVSAINAAGTGSPSNVASATTDKMVPQTTTDAATTVTQTTATLNGTLDTLGDFTPVDVFFRYRIQGSSSPYTETTPQEMTATGSFSANLSGLDPDTTYEFKTVVQWEDGGTQEREGTLATFTTIPEGNGIPECTENNVDCFVSPVTGKNVILEVDDACTISTAQMKPETDLDVSDPGFEYPAGLMNFILDCGTPGYSTIAKQYYFNTPDDNNYVLRKHNPNTKAYFAIAGATIEQTTLGGQTVTVATYQITDGGELDTDSTSNGTIVDPAGLALAATTTNPGDLASTGQNMLIPVAIAGLLVAVSSGLIFRRKMINPNGR